MGKKTDFCTHVHSEMPLKQSGFTLIRAQKRHCERCGRKTIHNERNMKAILPVLAAAALAASSCSDNPMERATNLLEQAATAEQKGEHDKALNLIDSLRRTYPKAIAQREKALKIYRAATEAKFQAKVKIHDELVKAFDEELAEKQKEVDKRREAGTATEADYAELTTIRMIRDSVKARFDAECAVIRKIRQDAGEKK